MRKTDAYSFVASVARPDTDKYYIRYRYMHATRPTKRVITIGVSSLQKERSQEMKKGFGVSSSCPWEILRSSKKVPLESGTPMFGAAVPT